MTAKNLPMLSSAHNRSHNWWQSLLFLPSLFVHSEVCPFSWQFQKSHFERNWIKFGHVIIRSRHLCSLSHKLISSLGWKNIFVNFSQLIICIRTERIGGVCVYEQNKRNKVSYRKRKQIARQHSSQSTQRHEQTQWGHNFWPRRLLGVGAFGSSKKLLTT